MPKLGSFLKGLFFGHIEEELIFPYPRLGGEEAERLGRLIDSLTMLEHQTIDAEQIDEQHCIPQKTLRALRELGLFGLVVPREHGGHGLGAGASVRVIEELARIDSSVAITVGSHATLGLEGLLLFGDEAQRARWLPPLAQGECLAAFAITEARGGSDVAAMECRARPVPEGYRISGRKVHLINAERAGLFTVFARVSGRPGSREGLAAFLIPRETPGLSVEPTRPTLGARGAGTANLLLDDVLVGRDALLGGQGAGFRVAMEILNRSRVAVAAGCLGLCRAGLDLALSWARERRAFGRAVKQFGMIQRKIGQMVVDTFVLDSLTYLAAGLIDHGRSDSSIECAVAKIYGSECANRLLRSCQEISGGASYFQGHPVERLVRDGQANLFLCGTNEVLRVHVALAGLAGPLEYLRSVEDAVRHPLRSVGLLADYALDRFNRRWKRDTVNLAHSRFHATIGSLTGRVAAFGDKVEALLRELGPDILEAQFVQERLANVVVDLYASFATLSRSTALLQQGDQEQSREAFFCARTFLAQADHRIAHALSAFDDNVDTLLRDLSLNAEHHVRRPQTQS